MDSMITLMVATSLLVLIPGPNVALIVARSLQYGFRRAFVTVLGTTAGLALQLLLIALGLSLLLEIAADALSWVRFAGAFYLVWLGIRTWRRPPIETGRERAAPTRFFEGCLLAAVNPKTLIFNAAFLPQFVGDGSASQFALVAGVFLSVIFIGDLCWAGFASSARRFIGRYASWRDRLTGAFLTLAGIGLALSQRR